VQSLKVGLCTKIGNLHKIREFCTKKEWSAQKKKFRLYNLFAVELMMSAGKNSNSARIIMKVQIVNEYEQIIWERDQVNNSGILSRQYSQEGMQQKIIDALEHSLEQAKEQLDSLNYSAEDIGFEDRVVKALRNHIDRTWKSGIVGDISKVLNADLS